MDDAIGSVSGGTLMEGLASSLGVNSSHTFGRDSLSQLGRPLSPSQHISPVTSQGRLYGADTQQALALRGGSADARGLSSSVLDVYNNSNANNAARNLNEQKEDFQRILGRVLVLKAADGKLRAPIITLQSDSMNVYQVLEKHIRPEYVQGGEKFWKVVRADLNLETWRPRVMGSQLKALQGARLPETEEEFAAVSSALHSVPGCMKSDTSVEECMKDLRKFTADIEVYWENRNKKPNDGVCNLNGADLSSLSLQGGSSLLLGASELNSYYGTGLAPKRPMPPQSAPLPPAKKPAPSLSVPTGSQAQPGNMPGTSVFGIPNTSNRLPVNLDLALASEVPGSFGQYGRAQHYSNGYVDAIGYGEQGPSQLLPEAHELEAKSSYGKASALLDNPVISLNVGGVHYMTTLKTLIALPGTFFCAVFSRGDQDALLPRLASGEYFLDRNGKLFHYILEFLRSCAMKESAGSPMPDDARELQGLAREAEFYGLPLLLERIVNTSIMAQPAVRVFYDSLYLETGFNSIEGPSLKEMESKKVVVMQQLNHVLQQKQHDGYVVDWCKCGVAHRDGPDVTVQHNLYYHILLKKSVPLLPRR